MRAAVDLSAEDAQLIVELGENAQIISEFIESASSVMARDAKEQDSLTYMHQQILKGILILTRLRPTD